MASALARSSISLSSSTTTKIATVQVSAGISNSRSISLPLRGKAFPSLKSRMHRLQVCCAAKPETVEKVCHIVKKQLALPEDTTVTADSKFTALGADSLDTVEIVMGLEEEFGISVEEESAQSIATILDAANMIEEIIEKKGA
ncbi:hypothetical protein Droror1_Dr00015636 [Drosera rotundifolia]